jgi:hypothetical protein
MANKFCLYFNVFTDLDLDICIRKFLKPQITNLQSIMQESC